MRDEDFEWDDPKAEVNFSKHAITFDTARRLFGDPNAIWDDDPDSSWNENRYRVVARVDDRVFVLSYTYREDRIRLISARRATKREHHDYYRRQDIG